MPILTPPGQRWAFHLRLVLFLLWAGASPLWAQEGVPKEYQIKAAFLFNFTQFIQWPSGAVAGAGGPFCIGILGDDPFDGFLDETVRGEKVDGHPLVVRRCGSPREAKDCQVLFISPSESKRMEDILAELKGRNILTVGDSEEFAQKGGIIRFVTKENKIHFRINLRAARQAKLTISSQMLRLAEIVQPGKE